MTPKRRSARATWIPPKPTLGTSYNEARSRAEEEEEWAASRELREGVSSRNPNTKLGDFLENCLQWHETYQRDPTTTADYFARSYASRGPVVPKPRQKHDDTPPAYLDEIGKRNWHRDNDVRRGWRDAAQNAADRAEFEATAKARALIKQTFPGRKFSEVMASLDGVDEAMQSAPHHVAQKLAQMYGAPATQGQVIEQHQAAQAEQQVAALSQWVSQVEASGSLPGLDHPKVQAATVQVLEHMNATGQRTGSIENDLFVAYQHAVSGLQGELQAEHDKAAVEQARRASRSLSGSVSTAEISEDRKPGSAHDSARAAYHSLAA